MLALRNNLLGGNFAFGGAPTPAMQPLDGLQTSINFVDQVDWPPVDGTITPVGWNAVLSQLGKQESIPYLRLRFDIASPAANTALELGITGLSFSGPPGVLLRPRLTVDARAGGVSTVELFAKCSALDLPYGTDSGTTDSVQLVNPGTVTGTGNGLFTPAAGLFSLSFLLFIGCTSAGTVSGIIELV
jgi:hypothetical protein